MKFDIFKWLLLFNEAVNYRRLLILFYLLSTARKKGEWEILEGLKEGQRFDLVPRKFEGFLLKRRKWPLKGWHKVRIR